MSFNDVTPDVGVYKCGLNEFREDLVGRLLIASGLVKVDEDIVRDVYSVPPLALGKPGVGKTCVVMSAVEEINKKLRDRGADASELWGFKKIQLGQTIVGELSGIPIVNTNTNETIRVQSDSLPVEERDGKHGVLFLDEITSADVAQIQPALGLADDTRSIGQYTLPEGWLLVAAGNGPDCTNFVRLDDATISRFAVFDIEFDYVRDWRTWAHENGVDELIIAFCNYKHAIGEPIVRVESTEADMSGKQFATPRSWTNLSKMLRRRSALGKPVGQRELLSFASSIIGAPMATEFAAFAKYREKVDIDPMQIVEGTAPSPSKPLETQVFHIVLQGIIKVLLKLSKAQSFKEGSFSTEAIRYCANAFNWILDLLRVSSAEQTYNGIAEMLHEIEGMVDITDTDTFDNFCPRFNQLLDDPDFRSIVLMDCATV